MIDNTHKKPSILIVDDEKPIRELLGEILSTDYSCITSESAEAALEEFRNGAFDLVLSDVNMSGMSGVEMVPRIHNLSPDTVVMLISGAASVETAIDAMRVGVFDYVRKPFDFDQVITAVGRALEHQRNLVAKRRRETVLESLVQEKTAELDRLTNHDLLTGLPNKTWLEQELGQTLWQSSIDRKTAVLLVGVTNLRNVRDSIGHTAANRILIDASERLQARLLLRCKIAKLDGDAFGLILSPADHETIVETANEVIGIFGPAFTVDSRELHAQVNVGISVFPSDGIDQNSLIRNAGGALSHAEGRGPGSFAFYNDEINERAVRQLLLENNLRHALERNELALVYQPKIDAVSGKIIGMEALLRWNSMELGNVTPDVFIPIAESTELIIPIGEWVLRTACAQTKAWQEEGFDLNVAINVSARQFHDENLSNKIWDTLDKTGVDPHSLNLEVTESSILTDPDNAIQVLNKLQTLGISISIDDFGTGHSSLGYLRSLPIDVLKIDKSFVGSMTTSGDDLVLVKTIIKLAHDLRLKVVAEGVETDEQLQLLKSLRCDEWQGYLHSKPLPPEEFIRRLRSEQSS